MIKLDTKGLDDLRKKVNRLRAYLQSQDQRNVSQDPILTNGPFLHEGSGMMSKEESLKKEQENPKVFSLRRSINDEIRRLLK